MKKSLPLALAAAVLPWSAPFSAGSSAVESPAPEQVSLGLILDCSASMWNKLEDGRYRIDAAKSALIDFLNQLEERPGLHVGLRLYGSQVHFSKPGACQDSVLVVPIEGFQKGRMIEAVRSARAIGATPLAHSMELMADDFSQQGFRQLIIFTDGEESCGGDVAAALQKLRSQGVEVDVRLIGIGLPTAAVERFQALGLTVDNTESLASLSQALRTAVAPALQKAGQSEPPPVTPNKTPILVRVVKEGRPWVAEGLFLRANASGENIALEGLEEGVWRGEALAGLYTAGQEGGDQTWKDLLIYAQEEPQEITLDFTKPPTVRIEAADQATVGTNFPVRFTGANGLPAEYLTIVPLGYKGLDGPVYARTESQKQGEILMQTPAEPGEYEIRFISLAGEHLVVAGVFGPVHFTKPTLRLALPETVSAMTDFAAEVRGELVEALWGYLIPEGGTVGDHLQYRGVSTDNPTLEFTSPREPGHYEIVLALIGAEENILARGKLQVVEAEYRVEAPQSAMAGTAVKMRWSGPRGSGVWLTIVPADAPEGAYEHYTRLADAEEEIELFATKTPGPAEIRIVSDSEGGVPVFRQPLELTPAIATLEGPEAVRAGEDFLVRWTGPAGSGDYLYLFPAGAAGENYLTYARASDPETPITFSAPEEKGRYEVRYITGGDETLATLPMRVE